MISKRLIVIATFRSAHAPLTIATADRPDSKQRASLHRAALRFAPIKLNCQSHGWRCNTMRLEDFYY